ncbi:hypothetical protein [Poriferisphaera sp. WC338]|uniref:hypothetical protein n=1 Tax=Poriferisphaera sp. WC338 TaxID=3425129 RepID=UPI003D819CA7
MSTITHIVLVGHCGFDAGSLRALAQSAAPNATIITANDDAAFQQYATPTSLFLINRVLGGTFAIANGNDLIETLAKQSNSPRMLLISNYPDALAKAEASGARPGFGKAQLHDPIATERIKAALH